MLSTTYRTITAAVTVLRSDLTALGLQPPAGLLQALSDAENGVIGLPDPHTARAALHAAVGAALAAGKDPAHDKAVIAALPAERLAQPDIADIAETTAAARIRHALDDHADRIVADLAALVDDANPPIRDAHDADMNPDTILNTAPQDTWSAARTTCWALAHEAVTKVDRATSAWWRLGTALGHLTESNAITRPLALVDVTKPYDQLPELARGWRVTAASGLPLALADFEQYNQRVSDYIAWQDGDTARREDLFQRSYRRSAGFLAG
jgi:hypothetical protein